MRLWHLLLLGGCGTALVAAMIATFLYALVLLMTTT